LRVSGKLEWTYKSRCNESKSRKRLFDQYFSGCHSWLRQRHSSFQQSWARQRESVARTNNSKPNSDRSWYNPNWSVHPERRKWLGGWNSGCGYRYAEFELWKFRHKPMLGRQHWNITDDEPNLCLRNRSERCLDGRLLGFCE